MSNGSQGFHGNAAGGGHKFSQVPKAEIQRSSFDRSFNHKTTFDAGMLVPVFVDEVLPGDTFNVQMTPFARLTTPIFPLMDNMYLDSHFFFVPNRLVWDNWAKFNGEQVNPGDSTSFLIPQVTFTNAQILAGTLPNYFGIGRAVNGSVPQPVNALPFRCFNLIYNQWFRDENMINSIPVSKTDGPDTNTDYVMRRRGKRHDYFTSCLPFAQKGTAVSVFSISAAAPVKTSASQLVTGAQQTLTVRETSAGAIPAGHPLQVSNTTPGTVWSNTSAVGTDLASIYPSNLFADLSAATVGTINDLRRSFQIQKLLERDARGGTRYTEIVRAHFGVSSPDARLQRAEYLGGGSTPVIFSSVPQSSASNTQPTPQGNLAAFATSVGGRHGFTKSFTEHGYVIGIVSVRADMNYQQGVNRMWKRSTRFDFYWPALSHIGEQAVLQGEIYADGNSVNEAIVFGYQERYAEYRYKPSMITGKLQSTDAVPLDAWHLAQNFSPAPVLNQTFIEENPPVSRVVAVASQPNFVFDSFFKMVCARPMPVYGVPGLIDHF